MDAGRPGRERGHQPCDEHRTRADSGSDDQAGGMLQQRRGAIFQFMRNRHRARQNARYPSLRTCNTVKD